MKTVWLPTFLCLISLSLIYRCSNKEEEPESLDRTLFKLTVSAGEGGIVSPDATGYYYEGITITLTATPDEGYVFDRWLGSDFDNNGCAFARFCRTAITMYSDRDVEAFFKKE